MSLRTVARRVEDPAFKRAVSEERGRIVDRATGLAADGLAAAVTRLTELINSPNGPVALGACKTLIATVVSLREAGEIERRLLELEEAAERVKAGQRWAS